MHQKRMFGVSGRGALLCAALLLCISLSVGCSPVSDPLPPDLPSQPVLQPLPTPPAPAESAEPELPPVAPEPSPAQQVLDQMTLYEKVCQLFVVFPSDLTGTGPVTQADDSFLTALKEFPVGGFLLDGSNMETQDQIRTFLAELQSASRVPLLFTCDEEGGRVSRLMRAVGTTSIGPMLHYRDQGSETARANAHTIASDMASLGFHMDLAPVADVWSNPQNTVIGNRAYSTDYAQAAQLVAAAVEGFHAGGVACTLKHFPGHGDTSTDTHYASAYVDKPLEQLRQEELLPFQAGIEAGADAVMLGHLILPEFGDQPILLSHPVVTGLLREEMGFSGVILTDSLTMKSISSRYSSGEIAVGALRAGVDLLLTPEDPQEAVQAILQALEQGELSQSRLDESVLRILHLKEQNGLLV